MANASKSSIVSKCALVMDVLAASRDPLTFSQIVERTGFVKSSCHRILSVLATERLIAYDKASKTYRTGERLNDWSRMAWRRVDLQDIASAEMRRLSDDLGANVALSVLDGSTILYLRTVDHVPVRYAAAMGDHAPLHCTAAGKVFLAHMSERRRKEMIASLSFEKMTETTITNAEDLMNDLLRIHQNGFGFAAEEEFLHVYGIACPIWGQDGSVAACLSIWTVSREDDARSQLEASFGRLKSATNAVSKALGWAEK